LNETPTEDSIVVVAAAAGALRPVAPVDVAEGGMDVGGQIDARGNPVEELEQLRAFVCDERPR
jgi:hypothetical protein